MTRGEIVGVIADYMNVRPGTDSYTRLGTAVDRHYANITATLGLQTSRRIGITSTATLGSRQFTFPNAEKIERVFELTGNSIRVLKEVLIDDLREKESSVTDDPQEYAIYRVGHDSITILMDCIAQTEYELWADVLRKVTTLEDDDEPSFQASSHDILVHLVLADELAKKKDYTGANRSELKAKRMMSELRLDLSISHSLSIQQNGRPQSTNQTGAGGSSSGSAIDGTISYTQTGLVTFDRGGAAAPPFAIAAGNTGVVTNLNADLLDGETGADFHNATNLSAGTVPFARLPAALTLSSNARVTQIAFDPTQSAASDANTLDDYQRGSWTPVLTGAGGGTASVYTAQEGRYLKIGRLVKAWFRVTTSTRGTITGAAIITGLPFAAVTGGMSSYAGGNVSFWVISSSFVTMTTVITANTSTIRLFGATAAVATLTEMAQSDFNAGTNDLLGCVEYEAL